VAYKIEILHFETYSQLELLPESLSNTMGLEGDSKIISETVIDALSSNQSGNALVISNSLGDIPMSRAYQAFSYLRDQWKDEYKIAYLALHEDNQFGNYLSSIALRRGYQMRGFFDKHEAISWLQSCT